MQIYVVTIDRSQFDKLDDREQCLLLFAGHFANELNSLIKLFHWSSNFDSGLHIEKAARNSQALMLARILTGKLAQGWELIQSAYFTTSLSKIYDPHLDEPTKNALKALKQYFSAPNIIRSIRNTHSFHYDFEELKSALRRTPIDEQLVFYMAREYVNSFYEASDVIANRSVLEQINSNSASDALEKWISDTTRVAGLFLELLSGLMFIAMSRLLPTEHDILDSPVIEIDTAPSMDEVSIPFFVATPTDRLIDSRS